MTTAIKRVLCPSGSSIAYLCVPGDCPHWLMLFNGYNSTMLNSRKAAFLQSYAQKHGLGFFTFDAFGHGSSDGSLTDPRATMSTWIFDAAYLLSCFTSFSTNQPSDQIDKPPTHQAIHIVASSMGAWVALKSLEQSQVIQLRGLKPPITTASPVSLASFTSLAGTSLFTDRIIASLPNRDTLSESVVYRPSRYGEPYPYSLALLSDAAKHRIAPDGLDLEGPDSAVVAALSPSPDLPPFCTEHHVHQPQECPTPPSQAFHFLHGSQDLDVSPSDSFHLAKACSKMYSTCDGPVQSRVVIVDEADHRLSDPRSLSALEAVLKRVGADSIQAGAVSVT